MGNRMCIAAKAHQASDGGARRAQDLVVRRPPPVPILQQHHPRLVAARQPKPARLQEHLLGSDRAVEDPARGWRRRKSLGTSVSVWYATDSLAFQRAHLQSGFAEKKWGRRT